MAIDSWLPNTIKNSNKIMNELPLQSLGTCTQHAPNEQAGFNPSVNYKGNARNESARLNLLLMFQCNLSHCASFVRAQVPLGLPSDSPPRVGAMGYSVQ